MSSTSNVGSWTRQTLSRPASISPSRSTRSSRSPVPDVEESTTSSPAVTDSDSSVGQVEHQSRQDRSSSSIPPSLPDSISHAESSHRESNPPTHPSLPNPTVDNRLATENIPSEAPPATKHPLDNFDYEQRFPEDPIYQERSPNARVWRVYLEECAIFDADMIGEARNGLDLLLVFAGLFSAVLSTFVAQTSQALSNNFIAVSTSLLAETVMIQRALANGTSPEMVPRSEMVSGPSSTDFWVNGLWFTSLTLSLCTALLAVLVKQWLHQYMSPTSGTYRDRSLIRQYRYDGLQKWRVMTIVGLLPIVLHITLCFFLVGLVVFLFPLSRPLAYVVASITVIVYGMYFILNILPLAYSQCPYRTPFSDILNVFVHAVPSLFLPFMTFVRGQLKEALSQANGIPTSDESSSESSAHVAASIREFFQHQLRSARRDVVAALDLEAPPPISPKGIPTLKDIECRASAAASHKIIETISFDAVSWLIRTTSNLPTKSIAVQSLGSFSVALKSDLRTLGHEVDFQAFLSPLIKTVTQWIYMVSVPLPGEDRRVERLYRARFACGIVDNPEQVHFFLAGLRFPRSDASEIPFSLEATFLTSGCDLFHEDGTQWASTDFLSRIIIASQTGKFIVLPIHVWQGIFLHCLSRNHSLPTLPTRFGAHLTHLCVLAFPTTTSPDPESDYNSEGPALVPIIHPSLRSSLQRLLYLTLIFKTKYTPNPLLPDSIELQSLLMVHNFLLFSYSLSPNAALAGLRGVWKEIVSFSQNSQLTQQTFQAIGTSAEQLLSLLTDDAEAQKSFEVLFSYDGLDEEERDYVELDPKAVHLYHDWVRLNYTALSKSSTGNTETDFSPLLLQLVVNRLLGVCTSCPPETIHHPQISRLLQTWTDSLYRDVPHAYEKFVEVDFLSLITPETVTYVFATYCLIVGGFVLGLSRRSLPPDLHRRCVAYLHMTHHLFAVCGVMALAKSRESDWRGYLFEYIFDRKATLSLLASIEPDHPVWQQRAAYMCGEDAPSFPPTEEDKPFPECYQLGIQELDAFFEDRERSRREALRSKGAWRSFLPRLGGGINTKRFRLGKRPEDDLSGTRGSEQQPERTKVPRSFQRLFRSVPAAGESAASEHELDTV